MNRVETEFVVLDKQQLGRVLLQNLATELRANAATCTGDQHHLPSKVARQQRRVWGDRLSPEQVLEVQFSKV